MNRLRIAIGVLVSVLLIALSGWLGYVSVSRSSSPISGFPSLQEATATPQVKTATVSRGNVRQILTVPGDVTAVETENLDFPGGGQIVEIDIQAGDQVTQGQTLAKVDAEPLKLALAQAQVDYQVKFNALNTLKISNPVTATDLMQAQVDLQTAQDSLKEAEDNLAGAIMIAPVSGRILSVSNKVGDTATAKATVIEMADLNKLEVETTVGQEDVGNVHAGQAVSVTFDAKPGQTFAGQVSRVVPTRSSSSGAVDYAAYVTLDQVPAGLLPDMTADADITTAERKDVLMLPRRSIRASQDATITVSVLERGRTASRSVKLGLVGDTYVEIVSGLQEGDQVVTAQ